jgi:hypothetical protein
MHRIFSTSPSFPFLKLVQWENARRPILVTLLPMVTVVRPVQPSNAKFSMLVTPSWSRETVVSETVEDLGNA